MKNGFKLNGIAKNTLVNCINCHYLILSRDVSFYQSLQAPTTISKSTEVWGDRDGDIANRGRFDPRFTLYAEGWRKSCPIGVYSDKIVRSDEANTRYPEIHLKWIICANVAANTAKRF